MSKRKWIIIECDGMTFKYNTVDTVTERAIGYRDIDDCYANPSSTKISIWKDWESWFDHNDGWCTVASYNCNFFAIKGYFTIENVKYFAYITHAHNRCWRVEG